MNREIVVADLSLLYWTMCSCICRRCVRDVGAGGNAEVRYANCDKRYYSIQRMQYQ